MNAKADTHIQRQRDRERRAQVCKHFSGIRNERCDVGLSYSQFTQLPCRPPYDGEPTKRPTCPKFEALGMEQVLNDDTYFAAFFHKIMEARAAVIADAKARSRRSGTIKCPACDSLTLRYTIDSNGQAGFLCSTLDCVNLSPPTSLTAKSNE